MRPSSSRERESNSRETAWAVAYWTLPALICLAVHWQGFREPGSAPTTSHGLASTATFTAFPDLLSALFRPKQRRAPYGRGAERAFFIVSYALFGLNSLPYRVVVFATPVRGVGAHASRGRAPYRQPRGAGFCAAILWTINSASMEPLGWACVYNEVMCASFLMGAFATC